jgi:hypothetical protein
MIEELWQRRRQQCVLPFTADERVVAVMRAVYFGAVSDALQQQARLLCVDGKEPVDDADALRSAHSFWMRFIDLHDAWDAEVIAACLLFAAVKPAPSEAPPQEKRQSLIGRLFSRLP